MQSPTDRARQLDALCLEPTLSAVSEHRMSHTVRALTLARTHPRPAPTALAPLQTRQTSPAAAPMRASILRMLNELHDAPAPYLRGVRLVLDDSPGFGHQAASLSVYRQLRAWGYTGLVQFVSLSRESHSKLLHMVALAKLTHTTAVVEGDTKLTPCALAVSGGLDIYDSETRAEKIVQRVRCDRMLFLQPFGWDSTRMICGKTGRALRLDRGPLQRDAAAFHVQLPAYDHYAVFLREFCLPSKVRTRDTCISNLVAVRQAADSGAIDTCVVYGRYAPGALARLIPALYLAQREAQPIRPTAVIWLNEQAPPGEHTAVSLHDAKAASLINRLRRGQASVIVLTAHNLPQEVFQDLFVRSTLPPVLEGCNTINLMRIAQRPYLCLHASSTFIDARTAAPDPLTLSQATRLRLKRAQSARRNEPPLAPAPGLMLGRRADQALSGLAHLAYLRDISAFMRQARDPESSVCLDYAKLGRPSALPHNDQLLVGMHALTTGNPAAPAAPAVVDPLPVETRPLWVRRVRGWVTRAGKSLRQGDWLDLVSCHHVMRALRPPHEQAASVR